MNKTGFKVEKKVKYLDIDLTTECYFNLIMLSYKMKLKKDFIRWDRLELVFDGKNLCNQDNVQSKAMSGE